MSQATAERISGRDSTGCYRPHETMDRPWCVRLPNGDLLRRKDGEPRRFSTPAAALQAAQVAA